MGSFYRQFVIIFIIVYDGFAGDNVSHLKRIKYNSTARNSSVTLRNRIANNDDIADSLFFDIANDYSLQMNNTLRWGLPKCQQCKKIGIVGAGVSGLNLAILLAEAGHRVTIFEASDRAGGRILTYRDPNNPTLFYGDLGAMRLPLDVHPYVNHIIRNRYRLDVTEFPSSDDNALVYINGLAATVKQAQENPDMFGFKVKPSEKGKTSDQLQSEVFAPLLQLFQSHGWKAVRDKYDSYSLHSYMKKAGLSNAAIDYISLMFNTETRLYRSILGNLRSMLLLGHGIRFYQIKNGNDRLVTALVADCLSIENNRCSIVFNTSVTGVQVLASNRVRLTTSNWINQEFDAVIIGTTATAAQLIDFEPRSQFINKYRAMRQLHYTCSSKILLFFNTSWWYTNNNITGGRTITDLPIRFVYYPATNSSSRGGTLLASYVASQDAIVWQSLPDDIAIEFALKQLEKIHSSTTNMRASFRGGQVKHWCADRFSHGAFAQFIPFQESDIFEQLQASVSNVHFIGEHTSVLQAWVEGSLLSSFRPALIIQEETFDIVIVGGGPVGLATAVQLSLKKPKLRIVVLEQNTLLNVTGNFATFDLRQFRRIYNEIHLTQLAHNSIALWRQLEMLANIPVGSILNTDQGYLYYSDSNSTQLMRNTCRQLKLGCIDYNDSELWSNYQAIFDPQGGFINITMLMTALMRIIDRLPNIILRQNEQFLAINSNHTRLITNRGSVLASRKVLFVPGANAKNMSHLFHFDSNVILCKMPVYHFRHRSNVAQTKTWLASTSSYTPSMFFGFPASSTSIYMTITPIFVDHFCTPLFNAKMNSYDIQKVIEWVSSNMSHIDVSNYHIHDQILPTTFVPNIGFLLDYVPNSKKKVLIQIGDWNMAFVPIWADILSDMMILNDKAMNRSKYAKYLSYFSLSRSQRHISYGRMMMPIRNECSLASSAPLFLLLFYCLYHFVSYQ